MAISGKVSAGTVAAGVATAVTDIIARHTFHGSAVPGDILALIGATVTAGVTFVAGYLAKHVPAGVASAVGDVVGAVEAIAAPAEVTTPVPAELESVGG